VEDGARSGLKAFVFRLVVLIIMMCIIAGCWMVATSGFMVGIDHPHVRQALFLLDAHDLSAFWQGAGRGGRDHKPYHVILFAAPTMYAKTDEVRLWREQPGCRTALISEAMDDVPVGPCFTAANQLLCDHCQAMYPDGSAYCFSFSLFLIVLFVFFFLFFYSCSNALGSA
jgi:hypothetical protein